MALNNPNDPTSSYPNQPGSAFSFNFNPQYIAQLSANPTNAANGGQAPSGFANLNQQSNQNNTQSSPVAVNPIQLLNTGKSLTQSSPGPITSAINNFGGTLGFANAATSNALSAGLSSGEAQGLGSIAQGFNAAGDSVVAGSAADVGTAGSAIAGTEAGSAALSSGTLSGATLSGVLGAASLGYIGGSILGKAVGGSPIGGSIGGAIGAGAGMALGGAGFAALGLQLGAFAGPVGALVGGIGGALFGSLFGGGSSPPTNADGWGANLTASGEINSATGNGGSKNAGPVAGFGQTTTNQFSGVLQAAGQALGIKFNPDLEVGAAISTKHPGPGGDAALEVSSTNSKNPYDTGKIFFDPNDSTSVQNAQLQALTAAAQQSGYTDTSSLQAWFKNYTTNAASGNTVGNATNIAPSIPTNPNASGTSDFQKFVDNYKAQQSVNAA